MPTFMKRIFFLALVSVTCENFYLVQGADPTAQPTFFPTLPVGEFKDFGLGWEPSMVIDDTTGMNLMFGGNGYDYGGNGKWLKCTHFDSRTCTNIHRHDVKYWTDSTLATRHASLRPANCGYPRVAQIPNGGDVLINCYGDDVIVRCPSDVNGANFEGDNCYVYMDSSTTGLSSWNEMQYITIDKYENLILADVNQKKVFLCDLGVTPTCSEILDLTSTGLSSITTCATNKVFFNDDSSKAFISCGTGVLEGTVSDHAAGSLTITLTQEYLDPANQALIDLHDELNGVDDTVNRWVGDSERSAGGFAYGDGNFYFGSFGYFGRIFKCTAANTCEQMYTKWSLYPGQDDSTTTLAYIYDLYYHEGCLYACANNKIFKFCPDGINDDDSNDDDDDDGVEPALIATSAATGVLGVSLVGAGVYIFQLQQAAQGIKGASAAHELVSVEEVASSASSA